MVIEKLISKYSTEHIAETGRILVISTQHTGKMYSTIYFQYTEFVKFLHFDIAKTPFQIKSSIKRKKCKLN